MNECSKEFVLLSVGEKYMVQHSDGKGGKAG